MRRIVCLIAALSAGIGVAYADDGLGLKRDGDPAGISISGVSSGAAMAVQYAVAHSKSIVGVGAVAGPAWGCAGGSLSKAVNDCMCGRHAVQTNIDMARQLAASDKIDGLDSGKPRGLKRSYIFHSPADATVVKQSGEADRAFLAAFIGDDPKIDWGNEVDGSDRAGHGIIAPDSHNESCAANGTEKTYVRYCRAEDNAGKMLHSLYDPDSAFDASQRVDDIPETEVWEFDQQHLIDQVRAGGSKVAADGVLIWGVWWPWWTTARRQNYDMADKGYIYVPPSCQQSGSSCHVHITLHGCKQDAKTFANKAGYNNWAERYKVIIVYPAVKPDVPVSETCAGPSSDSSLDTVKLNPNGCWDWWGYLDAADQNDRYLTKDAPQMLVIDRIIAEVTHR